MVMDFYSQQQKNVRKTVTLVIIMLAIIFTAGIIIDYYFGTVFLITGILLAITLIQILVSFGRGYKIVLSSVEARQVDENTQDLEEKQLLNIVEELSISAGMAKPQVYVMPDESINAFATGSKPEKSYVCVTTGLLKNLNREETEGVLAHEFSHIKNRDILLMTTISALVGGVLLLAIIAFRFGLTFLRGGAFVSGGRSRKKSGKDDSGNIILMIIAITFVTAAVMFLIGQISRLMTLAISRKREYLADATAVEFTRNPAGLSNALRKIYKSAIVTRKATSATAHLFISEPKKIKFSQKSGFFANLFNTHPPLLERIAMLENKDKTDVEMELSK